MIKTLLDTTVLVVMILSIMRFGLVHFNLCKESGVGEDTRVVCFNKIQFKGKGFGSIFNVSKTN
jgi:hypothetical protein